MKREFKFILNNDTKLYRFDCAKPFSHKCVFHPKQLEQLPLSGIWRSEGGHSIYTFYQDFDGNIIGYCDGPHICRIHGRRSKNTNLIQFEQRWTIHSDLRDGHDTNTVCTGVIDAFGDSMHLEYISYSETRHVFINRGFNTLYRLDRHGSEGCLSGNWRLFKYDCEAKEIHKTIHTIEDDTHECNGDINPVTPLLDHCNSNSNSPIPAPVAMAPIDVFTPQDSYSQLIEKHSQLNKSETKRFELKNRKYRRSDQHKHCMQLTHFKNDTLTGEYLQMRVKGRVFANERKFVLIYHWIGHQLFPCVTRVIGHFNAAVTRLCTHYQLLYPLGENTHYLASDVLNKIIASVTRDESESESVCVTKEYRTLKNNSNVLLIGDQKWLVLSQGKGLYWREFEPHCGLSVPFYDEFYDRNREIYSHSRHFAKGTTDSSNHKQSIAYSADHHILVLGEADFSFSLGLLRSVGNKGKGSVIGTSYLCRRGPTKSVYGPQPKYFVDSPMFRQFLDEGRNGELFAILHEIWRRKGRTFHGIDARRIRETLRPQLGTGVIGSFDRIIFPFPRASLRKYDSYLDTDMFAGLFESCKQELSGIGELHIILHTNRDGINQFDIWGIRDLAESLGMIWRAALPFDWKSIPPYHPKDVKNQEWKPYIATVHIFTPKINSIWNPKMRSWRPKNENYSQNIIMPKPNVQKHTNYQMIKTQFVQKLIDSI